LSLGKAILSMLGGISLGLVLAYGVEARAACDGNCADSGPTNDLTFSIRLQIVRLKSVPHVEIAGIFQLRLQSVIIQSGQSHETSQRDQVSAAEKGKGHTRRDHQAG
jgi:hypothetical protein